MAGAYPGHGGSAHTPAAAPPAVPVATGGHVGGALSQAMLDELQLVWCQAAGLWSRRLSQRGCAWLVWIVLQHLDRVSDLTRDAERLVSASSEVLNRFLTFSQSQNPAVPPPALVGDVRKSLDSNARVALKLQQMVRRWRVCGIGCGCVGCSRHTLGLPPQILDLRTLYERVRSTTGSTTHVSHASNLRFLASSGRASSSAVQPQPQLQPQPQPQPHHHGGVAQDVDLTASGGLLGLGANAAALHHSGSGGRRTGDHGIAGATSSLQAAARTSTLSAAAVVGRGDVTGFGGGDTRRGTGQGVTSSSTYGRRTAFDVSTSETREVRTSTGMHYGHYVTTATPVAASAGFRTPATASRGRDSGGSGSGAVLHGSAGRVSGPMTGSRRVEQLHRDMVARLGRIGVDVLSLRAQPQA